MLEVLAIFLTLGSTVYHFHTDFLTISIIGFVISTSIFFWIKNLKGFLFCILLFTTFVLGALNVYKSEYVVPKSVFGNRQIEAKIISVDRRLTNTFLVVKDREFDENIRISTMEQNGLLPGDKISLIGIVKNGEDFVTSSGRIFDYEQYLKNKNIVAVMENPQIKVIENGRFSITRFSTIVRYKVHNISSKYVTFPFDGVLSAMIFGYQGGVPTFVTNLFRDTGVLHMLVLSGYNITLMALFLSIILKTFPFKFRTIIIIIFIFALVMISGAGVAAIRAGIMGSIAAFAGITKRSYNPLRAMTLAYLFFFFITPNTIFSDPGFHLSFLATFFMIFVLPKTQKIFAFIPNYKYLNLREILSLAIIMPIFTLPYIMYFSGIFPLISPLANAVLSIFVPTIMILGITLIIISWISPIARIIGITLSFFGSFIIFFLQKISIITIWNTPEIPWWCVSLFYIVFLILLFKKEIILYLMQIRNFLLQQPNSFEK